jgi:hypothetical protein
MDEKPTEENIREFERLTKQAEQDFYYAIGGAITAWSRTEGLLVSIAGMLLDTTSEKVGLVLYSITNFYSWLSIIDELFVIDPQFSGLRSNWIEIAERLKKLNDIRVRLAHHSVESGRGIDAIVAGDELMEFFPSLKPNSFDTRSKSKKHSNLQMTEITAFIGDLASVADKISELLVRMVPIYMAPKRALVERFKELQRKAGILPPQEQA